VDEIIFEGRNRNYGAYYLRKIYGRHVILATGVTMLGFLLLVFTPYIIGLFHKDITIDQDEIVQVSQQAPNEMTLPQYVPPPPPAPARNTPPRMVKDTLQDKKKEPEKPQEKKDVASAEKTDSTSTQNSGAGSGGGGEGDDNGLYRYADVYPSYPEGIIAMRKFIQSHIIYPPMEQQQMIGGTVLVSVIINKDGSLSDFKIVKSVSKNIDAEAIRVIKLLPHFNPAMYREKPIRMITQIPVTFNPR
jgi:protein TonB